MYELGIATQSLKPAHEYTPWVTIDGHHYYDESSAESLESYLCSNYLKEAPECKMQTQMLKKLPAKMCFRENAPTSSVLIEVYYEALCGGCMDFITRQLHSTYMEFKEHLNVKFYPYGNTATSKNLDPYGTLYDNLDTYVSKCSIDSPKTFLCIFIISLLLLQ